MNFQPPDPPDRPEDLDDMETICDACSVKVLSSETKTGEPGSEYEGCTLCPDCFPTEGQAT